jgi:CRP-like cAMP-binding protein
MEPMKKMIKEALLDRILFFTQVPLFSTLSEEELLYFAGLAREEYYSDESTLLWEGNINDNLYILMEGNLELMKNSRAGWLGTIGVLGPKDFLGEGNLMKTVPSPVSAEVCMGDARIFTFRKNDILKLMKDYPQFGINFVQELSERVRKLETLIVNIG